MGMMRIALITEALVTGGAETFVLRIAKSLQDRGHSVSLFVLRGDKVNHDLLESIAPDLPLEVFRTPLLRLLMAFDGLMYHCGFRVCLLRFLQILRLKSYLKASNMEVVHSHLMTADIVTARACKAVGLPWVTTMHGDYLAFESEGGSRSARIQDFRAVVREVEASVKQLVSITDQQVKQLKKLMPQADSQGRICKIYNGYDAPPLDSLKLSIPDTLRCIPPHAFVIGMVARGIRGKGWDVMVAAFQALEIPDAWLVLVGDGEDLQAIKAQVTSSRIVFTGNVTDPLRYIARFDIGCLPSRLPAESLPTVIIEYMLLGKPVIATDVGEVSRMINPQDDCVAGVMLSLGSVEDMTQQMKSAIERLYSDASERKRLAKGALKASGRFDMDLCVNRYLAIYQAACDE